MNATTYARVAEVFATVCDLEEDEREAKLIALCGDDTTLRREVEAFLRRDANADEWLASIAEDDAYEGDDRPVAVPDTDTDTDADGVPHPERLGPFRILGPIAEGGMGSIYEAEQEAPRRRVALKVIRRGFASAAMLRRFEHEAHVLGLLQHPGIARIYEAGTADAGFGRQPYFAMERVHGRSIVEYARAHDLSTRARLELIAQVCDAIHHAHQKGVIHRDLKPDNILIDEGTEPGARNGRRGEAIRQPKVLDFGVARVTDLDLRTTTLQTDIGQLVGTVPYMSPEQASGDPAEIDIRTDVYSIGVVAFELLAGELPYPSNFRQLMMPDAVQVIRDGSTTRLGSVDTRFRGDVETIVAKALAPDKDDRYDSAAAMAADIRRYLDDEPIVARPPSVWYQVGKFAKRNRPLLSGLAAAFVLLLMGFAGTTYGMVRARQGERDAMAIVDFLAGALESARPDGRGRDVLVRDVLGEAASTIATLGDNPRVEARLRLTIGVTFRSLGELAEARPHLERAVALYREHVPSAPEHARSVHELARLSFLEHGYEDALRLWEQILEMPLPDDIEGQRMRLSSRHHVGVVAMERGELEEAEQILSSVLADRRELLGGAHGDTLFTKTALARVFQRRDRHDEAGALLSEVHAERRRTLGDDACLTLDAAHVLGIHQWRQGQLETAEATLEDTLARRRTVLGAEHPGTLQTLSVLSVVHLQRGRNEQAANTLAELYEVRRRTLGPEASDTLSTMNKLAVALRRLKRYDEAIPLLEAALRVQRRELGLASRHTHSTLHNLGGLYRRVKRFEEAESLLMEVLALRETHLGLRSRATRTTMDQVARLWLDRGDAEKGLRWSTRVIENASETPSKSPHMVEGYFLATHGLCLATLARHAEAEVASLRSLGILVDTLGETHADTRNVLEQCVDLYRQWGKPEEARRYRERLEPELAAAL